MKCDHCGTPGYASTELETIECPSVQFSGAACPNCARDLNIINANLAAVQASEKYTVGTTVWNIEDIRDRFPDTMTDEELFEKLQGIQGDLEDAAISAGWDVIDSAFGGVWEG